MTELTYYFALPFLQDEAGEPVAGPAEGCQSALAAIKRADSMSRCVSVIGAVAFSRTGDPGAENFKNAMVLKKYGDVPDDLTIL